MPSPTPLVVLGEVSTCLAPSASALDRTHADELLALMPGRAVSWRARPSTLAVSPTTAIGVDCDLALRLSPQDSAAYRARNRRERDRAQIVGTVGTRVVLAGGRILQSSVHTQIVRSGDRRRQPWSHYVSRKAVTEVLDVLPAERGTASAALAKGYLPDPDDDAELGPAPDTGDGEVLDLASISRRLLGRIRTDPRLDQSPPVQAGTTRLRWTALVGGAAGPTVQMRLDEDNVRTVRLVVRKESDLDAAQRFCEDLAAHDWLLTVVADALDEADRFGAGQDRLEALAPLVQHFTGLWMPGAHTPAALRALWRDLQSDPGFTRQWTTLRDRLRDNISIATLYALRHKEFDQSW
ncbi:hypothetical protein ABIA39_002005 [Nocardia sp. GAS34]|uniref:SCO2521 family protein n=1 Tax=unclassified Nocardia TaxID=2637762 RepID=UPI003D1B3038